MFTSPQGVFGHHCCMSNSDGAVHVSNPLPPLTPTEATAPARAGTSATPMLRTQTTTAIRVRSAEPSDSPTAGTVRLRAGSVKRDGQEQTIEGPSVAGAGPEVREPAAG